MITLVADDKVLAVLSQAKELAEIRDTNGKVIGFFAPLAGTDRTISTGVSGRLDPVEIARRKVAQKKGFTTREVFEHLVTLTKDERLLADLRKKIELLKERDECATP